MSPILPTDGHPLYRQTSSLRFTLLILRIRACLDGPDSLQCFIDSAKLLRFDQGDVVMEKYYRELDEANRIRKQTAIRKIIPLPYQAITQTRKPDPNSPFTAPNSPFN